MATIQDVARRAGVGAATVSRVLSGKGYVKAETREKILNVIEELDYTPNEMARNLFYRKSGIVAVIVPEISHPFFAELVNAIEVALCVAGYQAMICNTFYEQNYEQRYIDMLKRQIVDGIIFAAHTSLDVARYENLHRPIIAFDRDLGPHIPCIAADHISGGRMAAEELIRCGCKNVVQFGGASSRVITPSDQRHVVFQQLMEEHGISCHSISDQWHALTTNHYHIATEKMFQDYPDVDGIFGTDLFAMACLQYALEHGRRVPEDVRIVAYDGTNATKFLSPSVTTICQPIEELANQSVRMIIDLIQGKTPENMNTTLPVSFRPGASTRAFKS